MPTLFDAAMRERAIARVRRLTPEHQPRWGRLDAPHLLTHLIDAFALGFGEKEATAGSGFLSTWLGRTLALRLPIPRGRITAPPMFHETEPGDFAADRERVCAAIERFAQGPDQRWGVSPIFGHLTPRQWAHLHRVHLDHHLKQFGV